MDANKYIDLAKSYVELSNKHNLKLIALMFEANATYHSSYFGTFTGVEAINKMMAGFFTRFPDVYWDVSGYQLAGDGVVEFTFVMTGTDAATDESVKRNGLEQITFSSDGFINHIDVQRSYEAQPTTTTD